MRAIIFLTAILSLTAALNGADLYFKQQHHTDAVTVMGRAQPARNEIMEVWMTPTRSVMSSPESKSVYDLEKKTVTLADHTKKTVMQVPLDFTKAPDAMGNMNAKEKEEFQKMMGALMDVKVTVQPTGERRKIRDWQCQKYLQTIEMGMGKITSEIWATADIKIDQELYAKYTSAMMAAMPGMSQNLSAIMNEMKKIKGVQVYTVQQTEMMGQKFGSTMELLEYKEGKAPESAFDLPAGYKKQSMF